VSEQRRGGNVRQMPANWGKPGGWLAEAKARADSVVRDDPETLAKRINACHRQVEITGHQTLKYARDAGRLLLEAKEQVAHGEWQEWVRDNCQFALRTAQAYMSVARRWPELEAKTQRVARLSLRRAIAELTEPKQLEPEETDVDKMLRVAVAEATARPPSKSVAAVTVDEVDDEPEVVTVHVERRPRPTIPTDPGREATKRLMKYAEGFVTSVELLMPHLDNLPEDEVQGCAYKVVETVVAAMDVLREHGHIGDDIVRGVLGPTESGEADEFLSAWDGWVKACRYAQLLEIPERLTKSQLAGMFVEVREAEQGVRMLRRKMKRLLDDADDDEVAQTE
jgi:hypothetical protein